MIESLISTPDQFKSYLQRLPPDAAAGTAGYCRHCPIAKFLMAKAGAGICPSVHFDEINYIDPETLHTTIQPPDWVSSFVELFDESTNGGSEIEAQIALQILEESLSQ